jgi:hypothetical protein
VEEPVRQVVDLVVPEEEDAGGRHVGAQGGMSVG